MNLPPPTSATQHPIVVAPSLLAADPARLGEELLSVKEAGADWIHVDVMDGSFVPPITFGDNIVKTVKRTTSLFADVHLMIVRPDLHLSQFQDAGADRIIVHQEVCPHLHRVLEEIKKRGMKCGVAINPGTPVESVIDVLSVVDLVLVMTVNPGWGGQAFLPHCLDKITRLAQAIKSQKAHPVIEVDGGITPETAQWCAQSGASVFVAGSAIFGASDRRAAIASIRSVTQ